jgi:hypothetical protein
MWHYQQITVAVIMLNNNEMVQHAIQHHGTQYAKNNNGAPKEEQHRNVI